MDESEFLKDPIPVTEHEWSKQTVPLVSIGCITFNHEKYIEKAIKGFLKQETTFPVEIIIHDDASTDKTSQIVREYGKKYPNLIKTLIQDENQFSKGGGIFGPFVYPMVTGKYIAFCEGDDYWMDPYKLQKQVEFMEANPDFSLCSHEAYYTKINDPNSFRKFAAILYRNFQLDGIASVTHLLKLFIQNNNEFWKRRRKSQKFKRYSTADFEVALNTASSSRYIPTLSIVARAEYLKKMPDELFKLTAAHRLVILWSALHGKLKHFKDVMGVKNTQENSVTVTKVMKTLQTKSVNVINIEIYEILKNYSSPENARLLEDKIKEIS